MNNPSNKQYLIKFYAPDGTILSVLDETIQSKEIAFSSKFNSGQGELSLDLRVDFDDLVAKADFVELMTFVRIYEMCAERPNGVLLYTGFVSKISPYITSGVEGVSVTILGLGSLLALSTFGRSSGGVVDYATTTDVAQVMRDILDEVIADYPGWMCYTAESLPDTGIGISNTFKAQTWQKALEKTRKTAGGTWYWFVGADGLFYLRQRPTTATHRFILGKDILNLQIETSAENIVNDITLTYKTSSYTQSDTESIGLYGRRKSFLTDKDITDSTTAANYVATELAEQASPKIKCRLSLGSEVDFAGIMPGETCKVLGTKAGTNVLGDNMQIAALSYTPDVLTLELEEEQMPFAEVITAHQTSS